MLIGRPAPPPAGAHSDAPQTATAAAQAAAGAAITGAAAAAVAENERLKAENERLKEENEGLEIQSKNAEGTLAATEIVVQALNNFTAASSNVLKMNTADPKALLMRTAPAPLLAGPDEPAEPAEPAAAFRSLGAADMEEQGPAFCSLGGTDEPEP